MEIDTYNGICPQASSTLLQFTQSRVFGLYEHFLV